MSRQLKYEKVREKLRRHIQTRYTLGEKIPSTLQLHRDLGVSPQTINRALQDLVDEGQLERRPRRGTFITRPRPQTRNIALVCLAPLPNPLDRDATWEPKHGQYLARVIQGAELEAKNRGRHVLVALAVDPFQPAFTAQSGKVAGVILIDNRDVRTIQAYHALNIPVVLVEPHVRSVGVPFVAGDHTGSMREAVLSLVRRGHRRIVHVTVDFPTASIPLEEQAVGYRTAMREAGLQDLAHIHTIPFGTPEAKADADFVSLLRCYHPTACCCCADGAAAGVARIANAQGIRVPEQMSVIGVDLECIAERFPPRLTTIRVPMERFGAAAVGILEKLIESESLSGEGTVFPMEIVERAVRAIAVPAQAKDVDFVPAVEVLQ